MADDPFEVLRSGDVARMRGLVAVDPGVAMARDGAGLSVLVQARYEGRDDMVAALLAGHPELGLWEAAVVGDPERVAALVRADHGALAERSADGYTALHGAAFFGHPQTARVLLDRGADPRAVADNEMRVTPLHSAAAASQEEIAQLLLARDIDVNARSQGGHTPLHAAAANGASSLVELLLEHGATPDAANDEGRSPIDLAVDAGHGDVVALLRRYR